MTTAEHNTSEAMLRNRDRSVFWHGGDEKIHQANDADDSP